MELIKHSTLWGGQFEATETGFKKAAAACMGHPNTIKLLKTLRERAEEFELNDGYAFELILEAYHTWSEMRKYDGTIEGRRIAGGIG